jgi:hypothetical protein
LIASGSTRLNSWLTRTKQKSKSPKFI